MFFRFRSPAIIHTLAVSLMLLSSVWAYAQADIDLADAEGDPIKLFQRGQDAHEKRNFELALTLYDEAIKLKPEFPEAEYQRGMALQSQKRLPEAEAAYRRAFELRPEWVLPQGALGALLLRNNRFAEAEKFLTQALELGDMSVTLGSLASSLRQHKGTSREAFQALLRLLQRAIDKKATPDLWVARGMIEESLGQRTAAMTSYDQALKLNPQTQNALIARAQLQAQMGDYARALSDAQAAHRLAPRDMAASLQIINIYLQAGKKEEARRAWDALDEETKRRPEAVALQNAFLSCEDDAENRAGLEKALTQTPRDAQLLACLGSAYRKADPARSLEFYRRAADLEPNNLSHASGYVAALVQARRFAEAVIIARRLLGVAPDKYEIHANLATALYELKRFPEALDEFRWLAAAKPDLAVTYFFIATAHDFLGEYTEALAAYENFLARADAQSDKLEIEKINLRLPSLRNQIKRGEGVKKRP